MLGEGVASVYLAPYGLHQPSGESEAACQSERALRSMGQPIHLDHDSTAGCAASSTR